MSSTKIVGTLTTSAATAFLAITLAGCGGGSDESDGSAGDSPGASSTASDETDADDSASSGASDAKVGKTFCTAIKKVQADLGTSAASAAYLAQLTLKTDPVENATLSAAVVDKATKQQCPTEYAKFLDEADITTLRDVGLQP